MHTNKPVTGADQPTKSPNMSAKETNFHLFGNLPYEIRLQIWETAVFDLPSRVCGLDENIQEACSNGNFRWKDPNGLVVLDSPSLRYVCQESRQVALKHASATGWTVSGKEPPYRHFDPSRDVLYILDFKNIRPMSKPDESDPMAAMMVRQARHIALSWSLLQLVHFASWDCVNNDRALKDSGVGQLLQVFPRLEEISVALSQVDLADFVASRRRWAPWRPPRRPCKLESLARLEPACADLPETAVGDNAQLEGPLRSLYRHVKKISGTFVEAADIIAPVIGTQPLPAPMIAQVCQFSQDTSAGYKWEELPGPT